MVEFALLVPLLLLLSLGIAEYGVAWSTTNDVNAAARDAARVGSSNTGAEYADRNMIRQIGVTLNDKQLDDIQRVVIFKATGPDVGVPHDCLSQPIGDDNNIPFGVTGVCNVYNRDQVAAVVGLPDATLTPEFFGDDGSATNCATHDYWDKNWCPTEAERQRTMNGDALDYLGVYIQMNHRSITHFGFGDQTITRTAVFRLEPMLNE